MRSPTTCSARPARRLEAALQRARSLPRDLHDDGLPRRRHEDGQAVSGVLILPQRQTGLVAKQAAEVDILSAGRLRLGVGVGWNHVEYEALGMDWKTRGARQAEQIEVLRRLWTEDAGHLRRPVPRARRSRSVRRRSSGRSRSGSAARRTPWSSAPPARRRLDADHGARTSAEPKLAVLHEHLRAFGRDPAASASRHGCAWTSPTRGLGQAPPKAGSSSAPRW